MRKKNSNKNSNKNVWIVITVIIGVLLLFIVLSNQKQEVSTFEEEGISLKPVIVDVQGNVIKELSMMPLSIIAKQTGTGFNRVDNVATFLAIQTRLDNTAGDSEITATDVVGTNPCTPGNSDPDCATISNIFGVGGVNKGNLNALWDPNLPLILLEGQQSSMVQSGGMALTPLEVAGLIDFTVVASGTYLDSQGNQQPLSRTGTVTLRIVSEVCSDGTAADYNSADADATTYCSLVGGNQGKYCRVNAYGNSILTDRASLCEAVAPCPAGFVRDGEVCRSLSCGGSWATNTCNPSGGVLFCKIDGTTEARCNQCGVANCPLDANNQVATGCTPPTGEPSICAYPGVSGSGFQVSAVGPTINPINECGDGVKGTSESCDGSDLGGQTCISQGFSGGTLACNAVSCTFNTAGCSGSYVKFRSSTPTTYTSSSRIAVKFGACNNNNPLTAYGYEAGSGGVSGSCDATVSHLWCDGTCTRVMTGLPGGWRALGNAPAIYRLDPSSPDYNNELMLCDDDGSSRSWRRYDTGSTVGSVETTSAVFDATREIIC